MSISSVQLSVGRDLYYFQYQLLPSEAPTLPVEDVSGFRLKPVSSIRVCVGAS